LTSTANAFGNPHVLCALEAAERVAIAANTRVVVYTLGLRQSALNQLGFTAVDVHPLLYSLVFQGTPLAEWYAQLDVDRINERWRSWHLSDIARTGLLWKYGGLYLDTDMILLRDDALDMPNCAAWQKPCKTSFVNGAALNFKARHPYLDVLVQHVISNYVVCDEECYQNYTKMSKFEKAQATREHRNLHISLGPDALTEAWFAYQNSTVRDCLCIKDADKSSFRTGSCSTCDSHEYATGGGSGEDQGGAMTVFTANAFYPVPYNGPRLAALWLERDPAKVAAEWQKWKDYGVLALHLWGSRGGRSKTYVTGSLMDRIYQERCPRSRDMLLRIGQDEAFRELYQTYVRTWGMNVVDGDSGEVLWRSRRKPGPGYQKRPGVRPQFNQVSNASLECICDKPDDNCGFDCFDTHTGVHHEFEAVQIPLTFPTYRP